MHAVEVYKAQDICGRKIPDLRLVAMQPFPDSPGTEALFGSDAKQIVDALLASLPGGTIDRVLVLMLQHRASSLVVSRQTSNSG